MGTDVDGAFKGPIELARRLARQPQVQKCVTTQWFRYALGRMETELDACTLDACSAALPEESSSASPSC